MEHPIPQRADNLQAQIPGRDIEREMPAGERYYPGPTPESSKMHPRTIVVKTTDHGYLVECGCKTVCIESRHKLLSLLERYLKDPAEVEKAFYAGTLL